MSSNHTPRPIAEVASDLGIADRFLVPYGDDKAKIRLEARAAAAEREPGRLILVSAITPTGAGEGKTTTSIGLAQGLAQIGKQVCLALREPSLGPIFGMKGGAAGGGKSVLYPSDEINLHFTGDMHAISAAHNLLASLIDNSIYQKNRLGIDSRQVLWRRVVDLNDRALRHVVIGLGGRLQGVPRETGFDITPASEVMATMCLAEDAEDLRRRLGNLLVAMNWQGEPVRARDLDAVGAMVVLLKDALLPNLVQTGEGVPALVHGGPFANIAHGCSSVIATKMALAHSDWVITEAGFGFDLGAEKFFDIKCVSAGLDPAAVVLVATGRALKRHGGVAKADLAKPDAAAVERGLDNLRKHVESIQTFNMTPVVALNRFATDTEEEIDVVRAACVEMRVPFAVSEIYEKGGPGGVELAEAVVEHAGTADGGFKPLYDWSEPIKTKMEKISHYMYGAGKVSYSRLAERQLRWIEQIGCQNLPLSVAKTPTSLTDDPTKVGRPQDFEITVGKLIVAAGAGYVVPLLGDILRMPGLPAEPQAKHVDLVDGRIVGLQRG